MRLALLLFLALALPARATPLLFPASQWDSANLSRAQSTGTNYESLLRGNPRYERLAQYRDGNRLRRLSRPVGRLKLFFGVRREFTTCTATLLRRGRLITSHHCIAAHKELGRVTRARLDMGYYSETGQPPLESFEVDLAPTVSDQRFDIAILSVRGTPSARWGHADLSLSGTTSGDELLIIHHPGGLVKYVTRGECISGPVTEPAIAKFTHRCDTIPGSSGAPIFNAEGQIVAIHCCGAMVRDGWHLRNSDKPRTHDPNC